MITSNLRSIGQVMFQGNTWTGVCFLLGIGIASFVSKSPSLLLCAILCTAASNGLARLMKMNPRFISEGLYGYNGTLIGIAGAVFFKPSALMYVLILGGTVFSVFLMSFLLEKLPKKFNIPALTSPFVFVTWALLIVAELFFPDLLLGGSVRAVEESLIEGFFKSFSQVFLLENSLTGVLFLVGIFLNSWRGGIFSLLGLGMALSIGMYIDVGDYLINHGLYGYNVILTSIALGTVFLKPGREAIIGTFFGIILTLGYQKLFSWGEVLLGLPALTAPFVFAVWTILFLKKQRS